MDQVTYCNILHTQSRNHTSVQLLYIRKFACIFDFLLDLLFYHIFNRKSKFMISIDIEILFYLHCTVTGLNFLSTALAGLNLHI